MKKAFILTGDYQTMTREGKEQKMGTPLLQLDDILAMDARQVNDLYRRHINPGRMQLMTLAGFDKMFVRAQGQYLWDRDGNRYVDCLGSYGALNIGHNHPEVLAALEKVKECPNLVQAVPQVIASALASNLAALTPGDLEISFFGNSGTEAVEGALKLARAATGREKFVYCQGSFHGKTMGSLSITGRKKYQDPFLPLIPGCYDVPFGDLAALEERLRHNDVAAFVVEPILGEGGVIVPPDGYLRGARALCRDHGTLLVVDEVQTGLGRTGYLFACEHEEVEPDVLCLAKSLGGGVMPIGAFTTTAAIWDKAFGGLEKNLLHSSTFGGNTLACTAGLVALKIIHENDLPQAAREKGAYFIKGLKNLQEQYTVIKDVRGRGLMIGLEFEKPAKGILDKVTGGAVNRLAHEYLGGMVAGQLLDRCHVLTAFTLNNPNVIRLAPPLTVEFEDLDYVLSSLEDVFKKSKGFMGLTMDGARRAIGGILHR